MQVALMTGRSDPSHCRPSPVQAAFLAALASPRVRVLSTVFPWPPDDGRLAASVPLVRASLANALQYLGSRRAGWAARHRPGFEARVAEAPRTVLLCGSCGLELLANLDASAATLARLHVLAFGPVARRRPPVHELLVVRGRGDRISRRGFAGDADRLVEGGHLDYLERLDTLALARSLIGRALAEVAPDEGAAARRRTP